MSIQYSVKPKTLPPTTKGVPLLGVLPSLLNKTFDALIEFQQRYGDIYTLDLGVAKWVILNNPHQVDYILRENAQNYSKGGDFWDMVRTLLGNGLVVSEGDFWMRQRRMMQPQFHRQRLVGLTNAMILATDESLASWKDGANTGKPFDIAKAFAGTTMRVIVRSLFGQGLSREEVDRAGELAAYIVNYLMIGTMLSKLPTWLNKLLARRYNENLRELDTIVMAIIERERQAETPSDSLLGMLLDLVDEESGERMTNQQLRDEVMTFFIAGYETTSLALSWTVHYLTQYPEVLAKVTAEINSVIGERTPAFTDLNALTYTRMVLQEVLRLRPPSWWFPRTAVEDDEIDGYAIPAGTTVVSFNYGIHHNPKVWENPERFDPERFASEQTTQRHKLAWMPFGAGQRKCIGQDFAIIEAQIILAMLLQRYTVKAVPGNVAEPIPSATLKSKQGVHVFL